ncbi:MAG TPA: Uma2 family endonuclease [Dehalococcoidia bacterium]|nr:Uma2 family endonuclease [Dehalococcoidia bacterium]
MATSPTRRLFTVDEYYRMAEAGILGEDERVELVEGEIIEMPPIGSQHASIVDHLAELLRRGLVPERHQLRIQGPLRLDGESQLQPDLTLLKPRSDFYAGAHPSAEDVLLLIAVSDTTLAYDIGRKQAVYADAGVPEYWVVDVAGRRIEVYRGPALDNYKQRLIIMPGESIAPLAFPDLMIAVNDVLA